MLAILDIWIHTVEMSIYDIFGIEGHVERDLSPSLVVILTYVRCLELTWVSPLVNLLSGPESLAVDVSHTFDVSDSLG